MSLPGDVRQLLTDLAGGKTAEQARADYAEHEDFPFDPAAWVAGTALRAAELLEKYGGAAAACAGKDFEHHERTEADENDEGMHLPWRWRCPACGTRGSLETINTRLIALVPMLYRLKEQMLDRDAVFLLPSDATPGKMGQFHGHDLYRVQGISEPMIALRAVP